MAIVVDSNDTSTVGLSWPVPPALAAGAEGPLSGALLHRVLSTGGQDTNE